MEQDNIFKTYDLNGQFGPSQSSWSMSGAANNIPQSATPPVQGRWGLQIPHIKAFLCPAAFDPDTVTSVVQVTHVGYADTDYRGSLFGESAGAGPMYTYHIYSQTSPYVVANTSQTHYLYNRGYVTNGSAQTPPFGPFPGPFKYSKKQSPNVGPYQTASGTTPDGRGQAIVSVTDGTSNTIFFMETNSGYLDWGNSASGKGWVGMNFGQAPFYADFGTCPDRTNATPNGNCDFSAQGKGFGWAIPSSNHTSNRIMTLFGDGSVRGLAPNVNYTAFVYMCGATDGQIVTFDQ